MRLVSSSPSQSEIRTATVGAADVQWPAPIPPKTSAGEVRCQLYVAKDQGYIDQGAFEELSDDAEKITRQLYRLIEHLENSSPQVSDIDKEYLASPK